MNPNLRRSSSSSDECDKRRDPNFYRRPVRVAPRNHPKRMIKKNEKNEFEVGNSSSTRSRRRRRHEASLFGVRRRREVNDESGVRTTLLSWLVKNNLIRENTKLTCVQKSLVGHIKRGRILCVCCNEIHTPLKFVTHNMGNVCMRPYENIFVAETGISLISVLENALISIGLYGLDGSIGNGPNFEHHDDVCIICADGGDLMCCDSCTSVYHGDCMGLKEVPQGSWFCPYCQCKFCRGPCRGDSITCLQCEKKYHGERYEAATTKNVSSLGVHFCDANCREVYERLNMVVEEPQELAEGFSWTLLHRLDVVGVGIRKYKIIECHSKLALAMDIINESFEPVIDRVTGINMIENVVYNRRSNCKRLDYKGFYIAILEKDDEIVSVASLRIHGRKFAELPFIATTGIHRKQGNCRRLLSAIESALSHMEVQNLVLPSTVERFAAPWEWYYGFQRADPVTTNELLEWNAMTFHNSIWLQKKLSVNPERGRWEGGQSSRGTSSSQILFDLNEEPPEDHESL